MLRDTEGAYNGHAHAKDGTLLAYSQQGKGKPLVLLAGQANSHHWWDGVRQDFHGRRSTIAPDYRGTGDSGKPTQHYSTIYCADDVVSVLDAVPRGLPTRRRSRPGQGCR